MDILQICCHQSIVRYKVGAFPRFHSYVSGDDVLFWVGFQKSLQDFEQFLVLDGFVAFGDVYLDKVQWSERGIKRNERMLIDIQSS